MYLCDWQAKDLEAAQKLSNDGNIANQVLFSRDGKYLLVQEKQRVIALDGDKVVGALEGTNFQAVALSPQNKFALAMDKLAVDQFRLHVLAFPSLQVIEAAEYKRFRKEQWPPMKFTCGDKYAVRLVDREVRV